MQFNKNNRSNYIWFTAFFLGAVLISCSDSSSSKKTDPEVTGTHPVNDMIAVPINHKITATFSESMDEASLNEMSFTVETAIDIVEGTISYDAVNNTAIFKPASDLESSTEYTATITTEASSSHGRPMLKKYSWFFASSDSVDAEAPQVLATNPEDGEEGFGINKNITANFSEALNPLTVNSSSFTLSAGGNEVSGEVIYDGASLSFDPRANLATETLYTARLTTMLGDLAVPMNEMESAFVWTFTTGSEVAKGPAEVNLRSAGDFVILTKTGVTNVPTSAITGNIGASPITAAAMDNVFCTEITGIIYGADAAYTGSGLTPCFAGAAPDITYVATAVLDMGTAYTDAAGRSTPDFTELHAGDISGKTLVPGLYKWGTGVLISTDVTISGGANDVWIFQIAGDLTQENGSSIILIGGAQAKNIFWQVAGGTGVAIGTNAEFKGVVLAKKGITVNTGSDVKGRLLSQTAVTLDQNSVRMPQ